MKILNSLLLTSILFLVGCNSIKQNTTLYNLKWPMPVKPTVLHVEFKKQNVGLYLDETNSFNLLSNINAQNKYINDLEFLISEMKKFYNAK
jgi:ABC-type uncharacterized transport system auxiliary subunit